LQLRGDKFLAYFDVPFETEDKIKQFGFGFGFLLFSFISKP
jgi:hypothetical protein